MVIGEVAFAKKLQFGVKKEVIFITEQKNK